MKFLTLFSAFILSSFFNLFSQSLPEYLYNNNYFENKANEANCRYEKYATNLLGLGDSKIVWRPYNVLNYDIYMDWSNPLNATTNKGNDRVWTGLQKISLKIDSANTSYIDFDADSMLIQSVKINNTLLSETPVISEGILRIPLNTIPNIGDTLIFVIEYKTKNSKNLGFYLYNRDTVNLWGEKVFLEERGAYTMSEPQDARFWMPCNDNQHDKAYATITVKVPKGYNVASNGLLVNTIEDDSSSTYIWKERDLISTYLIQATASKYKVFTEWYHKVGNPKDSIPLIYYVWQSDYDGSIVKGDKYDAKTSFKNMAKMIEGYETLWGEYPFCKYGMVSIQPFSFGGMEHQTMTSINRDWLKNTSEGGIAHELAHQWLGDLITCGTWNDIWINEGGATWGEGIWQYYKNDMNINNYKSRMYLSGIRYLNSVNANPYIFDLPIYGLPIQYIFQISSLTYDKAGFVYHMLFSLNGDTFLTAMQQIFKDYKNSYIETKDFQKSLSKYLPNSKIPVDTIFNQWIYKAGHPRLNINLTYKSLGDSISTVMNISQIQTGELVPEIFNIPFTVYLCDITDTTKYIQKDFILNSRTNQFEFTLPYKGVYKIIYERSNSIFEIKSEEILTSVNEQNSDDMISILNNQITNEDNLILQINLNQESNFKLEIMDIDGKIMKNKPEEPLSSGNYNYSVNTQNLNNGIYFAIVRLNNQVYSRKFIIIR